MEREPWALKELRRNMLRNSSLSRLVVEHQIYRSSTLNLIPSENALSPAVLAALSSDLEGRYTLPLKDLLHGEVVDNGYRGTKITDEIERESEKVIKNLFRAPFCNVRPLSGHMSAMIVLGSLLKRGEKISAISVDHGGYDGYHPKRLPSLLGLKVSYLPFDVVGWDLDYDSLEEHFKKEKPTAVVIGSSFPLFPFNTDRIREAMDDTVGTEPLLLMDASHVMGLIAGKVHPDPLKHGVDLYYGSTHKTFPGPQRGIILSAWEDLMEKINENFFWRWQDNCHWASIAALGVAAEEMKRWGAKYSKAVVSSAKKLARALSYSGLPIRAEERGFTRTHQIHLLPGALKEKWGMAPPTAAGLLERAGIIIDNVGRMGTQEMVRLGASVEDMVVYSEWIVEALTGGEEGRKRVKERIKEYRDSLVMGYTF